jgi:thiol-disulfide isomerase/thioredoxin
MKKTLFIHLTLLSILLTGCQINTHLPTISRKQSLLGQTVNTQSTTIDAYVDRLTLPLFATLVSINQPYLIYVGNPFCGSCENFKPILLNYIRDTQAQVYYLNTFDFVHDVASLQTSYPTIFPSSIATPTLIIGQGLTRYTILVSPTQFYQYSRFKPLMDSVLRVGMHHTAWWQLPSTAPTLDVAIFLTVGESYALLAQLEEQIKTFPITLMYLDLALFLPPQTVSWIVDRGYPLLSEPIIVINRDPQKYILLSQLTNSDNLWQWFEVNVL